MTRGVQVIALEAEMGERKCRCREPKRRRDCMYCGSKFGGEVVCGVCWENGIDGSLIRGAGRIVCAKHRRKE